MILQRPFSKNALVAAVLALSLAVPTFRASALIVPDDFKCSTSVIDRRGAISYDGCGNILWGDTWHRYF
ncbi:MAG: hypothetical protein ABIT20_25425 [Gemmatimonadaceae bacterium]